MEVMKKNGFPELLPFRRKQHIFFFQIQVILEIGKKILEIERDYFQVSCVFAFEVYCDPYVRKLPTVVVMIADL